MCGRKGEIAFFRRPAMIKKKKKKCKKNHHVLFSYFCRAFPRLELLLSFLRKLCLQVSFLGFCKHRKRISLAEKSRQEGSRASGAAHCVIILPLISADTVAQTAPERVTSARTRLPSPLIKVKAGIAMEPRSILRRKKTFICVLHDLEALSVFRLVSS